MSYPKKPERPEPVVIRKGVVEPPGPDGATPGAEAGEAAKPAPDAQAKAPARPLWQRLAEEKLAAGTGRPDRKSARPGGPRGQRQGGPGDRRRGERPRQGAERQPAQARERAEREPALPPGAPPPAPEAPAPDEGSFADLLAATSSAPRRRFQVGEKVAGKIIQIGHDVAFLELGSGVAEGMIEIVELQDEGGTVAARVGDIVDGVVVEATERGVMVSKGRHRDPAHTGRETLVEAARTGLPVEGLVKAANKGGLEVEVHGVRAFCPMSQIDVRFVGDPGSFVGQRLRFRVQRADARDAVLSRRALLEEERAERARRTREALSEGAVFDGTVTSVQDYGAFVDIGGIEGLVHVSELAWDRVSRPQDLLRPGDSVKVLVLRVEEDPKKGERISLSVRSLQPRPEPDQAGEPAPLKPPPPPKPGDLVETTVDRVEPFGVFVRFAGGRGLVPAAETGTPRGADLRKAFRTGEQMRCLVTEIDEKGRIRLSRTQADAAAERAEAREWMERSSPRTAGKGFGTLGDLLKDKLGH